MLGQWCESRVVDPADDTAFKRDGVRFISLKKTISYSLNFIRYKPPSHFSTTACISHLLATSSCSEAAISKFQVTTHVF